MCIFQVEGEDFQGTGPSKQIAKNICAEHVIQFVVTKKCNESRAKAQLTDPNQKAPVSTYASSKSILIFMDWILF